jgi:hypothetical protein
MFLWPFPQRHRLARPGQKQRPQRRGLRPGLEALEDRCVPSTLPVTSTHDNVGEPGTLRFAVANASSGDTILLTGAVKDGMTLTQGELILNQDVTIRAAGDQRIAISGNFNSRIFEIPAGVTVTLENLELTEGNGTARNPADTSNLNGNGGAILSFGTLTINNSVLDFNTADDGGGAILSDQGTLTINNSSVSENAAPGIFVGGFGGGIWNFLGTLTVTNSVFFRDSAQNGGGIINEGTMTVTSSSFSNDNAFGEGAGILNDGTMTVTGSAFTQNQAEFGAGIFNNVGDTATVTNSSFTNNTAANGGAIYNFFGTLSVGSSTFSGNSPDNITGGFNDLGGNIGLP